MVIFVDTAAFIALTNSRDEHFARAQAVQARLADSGANLATSEWVLAEYLGGVAQRSRAQASEVVSRLRKSVRYSVLPATSADFDAGLRLFQDRLDKDWSLVDCISISLCKRLRIAEVFTSDQHFRQAGLRILLP